MSAHLVSYLASLARRMTSLLVKVAHLDTSSTEPLVMKSLTIQPLLPATKTVLVVRSRVETMSASFAEMAMSLTMTQSVLLALLVAVFALLVISPSASDVLRVTTLTQLVCARSVLRTV